MTCPSKTNLTPFPTTMFTTPIPSVYFKDHPNVTLTFDHVKPYSQAMLSVSEKSLWVETESGTTTVNVSNVGTAGTTMGWTAEVTSGGSWLWITAGASGTNDGTVTCAFDKNIGGFREGIHPGNGGRGNRNSRGCDSYAGAESYCMYGNNR